MDELSLILFLLLVFVVLAGGAWLLTRRPAQREDDAAASYAAGLNFLIEGDHAMALKKLRETVRRDTDNVDAYLKIGDILRGHQQVEQAIKIHRDLTARTSLTPTQQIQILRSLVADYEVLGRYDLALQIVDRILALRRDDLWAREKQLQIYEKMENWPKASETYRAVAKLRGKKPDAARLASYWVQLGKKQHAAGKEKDARSAFRKAVDADSNYAAGFLELSDSYIREDRQANALETLKKYVANAPDNAGVAFSRIKQILFEIGEFSEIETIYNQVISKSPENWSAYLALAEIHDKKGEIDRAIEVCQQILQRNPDYLPAREHLVRYYHRSGKDLLAVEQALAILNEKASDAVV